MNILKWLLRPVPPVGEECGATSPAVLTRATTRWGIMYQLIPRLPPYGSVSSEKLNRIVCDITTFYSWGTGVPACFPERHIVDYWQYQSTKNGSMELAVIWGNSDFGCFDFSCSDFSHIDAIRFTFSQRRILGLSTRESESPKLSRILGCSLGWKCYSIYTLEYRE